MDFLPPSQPASESSIRLARPRRDRPAAQTLHASARLIASLAVAVTMFFFATPALAAWGNNAPPANTFMRSSGLAGDFIAAPCRAMGWGVYRRAHQVRFSGTLAERSSALQVQMRGWIPGWANRGAASASRFFRGRLIDGQVEARWSHGWTKKGRRPYVMRTSRTAGGVAQGTEWWNFSPHLFQAVENAECCPQWRGLKRPGVGKIEAGR